MVPMGALGPARARAGRGGRRRGASAQADRPHPRRRAVRIAWCFRRPQAASSGEGGGVCGRLGASAGRSNRPRPQPGGWSAAAIGCGGTVARETVRPGVRAGRLRTRCRTAAANGPSLLQRSNPAPATLGGGGGRNVRLVGCYRRRRRLEGRVGLGRTGCWPCCSVLPPPAKLAVSPPPASPPLSTPACLWCPQVLAEHHERPPGHPAQVRDRARATEAAEGRELGAPRRARRLWREAAAE